MSVSGKGVSPADTTALPKIALARLLGTAFKPGRVFGAKHWSKCIFIEIQMQTSQTSTPTFQLSCRLFFQGHPLAYLQGCGNALKTGAIFLFVKGTHSGTEPEGPVLWVSHAKELKRRAELQGLPWGRP